MPTPYRTGIPTIRKNLLIVATLIVKYRETMSTILPPEQMALVDDLANCAQGFLDGVDNPRPYEVL